MVVGNKGAARHGRMLQDPSGGHGIVLRLLVCCSGCGVLTAFLLPQCILPSVLPQKVPKKRPVSTTNEGGSLLQMVMRFCAGLAH